MWNIYDISYGAGLALTSPLWLCHGRMRRKVLAALRQRMGDVPARADANAKPAVLIHAVSLGELNAARALIRRLGELRPDVRIIVSTTTDTGFARASELFGGGGDNAPAIVRYPLDFSKPISRLLDRMRPSLVVLVELELWPNFMLHCQRRRIPVMVVNGRLTERSFRRYRLLGPLARRMFGRLHAACVQDQTCAARFAALGVPPERLRVTGTMKFDTAAVERRVDGDADLADQVGLRPAAILGLEHGEPLWVCGSTGPGEETLVLQQYRRLLVAHPRLRLAIVPRKPERFDEVESAIRAQGFEVVRRSKPRFTAAPAGSAAAPVILGDTMGELRKFYSLADVIFVGRSLVDLGQQQHGSDMIEAAALGKPVVVGPWTGNFADAMAAFRAADAIVEVSSADDLGTQVSRLLSDHALAEELGRRAVQVVTRCKGATERHLNEILTALDGTARL